MDREIRWLTSRSRIVLKKFALCKLFKEFHAFNAIRRFITFSTKTLRLSQFWFRRLQFTISHLLPLNYYSNNILLPLGIPIAQYLSASPIKNLHAIVLASMHSTYPAHLFYLLRLLMRVAFFSTMLTFVHKMLCSDNIKFYVSRKMFMSIRT